MVKYVNRSIVSIGGIIMTEHVNKTVNVFHRGRSWGPRGLPVMLTYIGAAIYFVEQAGDGFWPVVLALLQAAVWPVYVVYHVLKLLGA